MHLWNNASLEIVIQKILQNFELMSVLEFIFRKSEEVFKFTKDPIRLVLPLGIWKIFRIATSIIM